ncbi:MAG: exosortase-associated EpsI family protein, partial [Planctomycetes bacterium]|nr:exosortase-associated EpsI family protein [Planctomycetota bacterium]
MPILRALPWLVLYLCAGFSLLVERGLFGSPVAPDLARLPAQLGPLQRLELLPFEAAALGQDPPERYAFHRVRDAHGNEGRLFLAYYERAQRWSGRPHDVEKCYTALGWQQREAHRLTEAHRPWSRLFEREGRALRVVHWLERPGSDEDRLDPREFGARLVSGRGFRPDVVSIYLEFEAELAPSD